MEDDEDVKPYFRTLNTLPKLRDSLRDERLKDGMTKVLAVMASRQRYYEATEVSIDMLTRLAKRHERVMTWMRANQMSCKWLEKWLLGHRNLNGYGYLQQGKTHLAKPNSTTAWGNANVHGEGCVRAVDRAVAKLLPRVRGIVASWTQRAR